ncbi:MAG: autotransporter outer membrane beta-barrel domain-containing protein, partial [Alphaproteobacteria bacterium]|nr:autotransporter outer membrane beta-barrel domain-containing protein [Alphaproteobacteria bacterium]
LNGMAYGGAVSTGGQDENGSAYIGRMENVLFQGNYAQGGRDESGYIGAYGGALTNSGYIGSISGKFVNNHAENTKGVSSAYAGAIRNIGNTNYRAEIGKIDADFDGNYVKSVDGAAQGGAIQNTYSTISVINGNFTNNYIQSVNGATSGGALNNNQNGIINKIDGDFKNNHAVTITKNSSGGAIMNWGTVEELKGDFTDNYAKTTDGNAVGGALVNNYGNENSTFGTLQGNFENNKAISENGYAQGGAIYNKTTLENILNSSFINNSAEGNEESKGGAIYSTKDITITADNGTSLFQGNTVNGESNAIYMEGAEDAPLNLNLTAKNSGTITFDDAIDGQYYNINIDGDSTGSVKFNNNLDGVTDINMATNTVLGVGVNGHIKVENLRQTTTTTLSTKAVSSNTSTINVDLEVDKANNTVKSGVIDVAGDISGDYKVIVNAINPETFEGASAVFLNAPNDTTDDTTMEIARVMGSPYLWDVSVDDTNGFSWSLNVTDKLNPNYDGRMTAPEVVTSVGLHSAAIEQTRSVVHNVANRTAINRAYCGYCSFNYGDNYNKNHNAWIVAQGENANFDKSVDMEAEIWGVEAGFDLQNNINHNVGLFVSYRNGEYDLSGKGSKKYSTIGSDIEIDSYLAGLYYRYDKNMNWALATAHIGKQDAEASTKDSIAHFETDGIEFGASIEAGHTYALTDTITLDPSMGIYYTQINFDDASDNVGKNYEWDDIKHIEIEAGLKLEKHLDCSKVYIKPSVIQTISEDDSVVVTGLKEINTYHDQTLGRIEIGGRLGITNSLYGYGWINYTFGSSYDATALGLGLNYTW